MHYFLVLVCICKKFACTVYIQYIVERMVVYTLFNELVLR